MRKYFTAEKCFTGALGCLAQEFFRKSLKTEVTSSVKERLEFLNSGYLLLLFLFSFFPFLCFKINYLFFNNNKGNMCKELKKQNKANKRKTNSKHDFPPLLSPPLSCFSFCSSFFPSLYFFPLFSHPFYFLLLLLLPSSFSLPSFSKSLRRLILISSVCSDNWGQFNSSSCQQSASPISLINEVTPLIT